jgi:hypothetical protein
VRIVGRPLGSRYTTPPDTTTFVRDAAGVLGQPDLAAGLDPPATLADEAVDGGYRRFIWRSGTRLTISAH